MMMNLFSPVDIEPVQFAALTPALQTEALRLMAEAGLTVPRMREATGLDCADILAIGRRRHHVRAFDFERSVETNPAIRKGPRLSPAAKMMLGHMHHHCGVLAGSLNTLSYDIGISEKSAKAALIQLTNWGFIEKTREGLGGTAAHYRLTATGEALAVSTRAGAAAVGTVEAAAAEAASDE
jgi:hypothetical protein